MRDGRIDGLNPWPIALVLCVWLWAVIFYAAGVLG